MGNDEAVTPVFPVSRPLLSRRYKLTLPQNSDYCTGVAGSIAILQALIRRSEEGGSFAVDVRPHPKLHTTTLVTNTFPSPL